jgi:hypothetical protein
LNSLGFYNRWLDDVEFRGAFIIVVPLLTAVSDVGMGYDDTASVPAAFNTTAGRRACTAYDVPNTLTAELQGGYDGFDLSARAVYFALNQTLQKIKAAGVAAIIELQGQ